MGHYIDVLQFFAEHPGCEAELLKADRELGKSFPIDTIKKLKLITEVTTMEGSTVGDQILWIIKSCKHMALTTAHGQSPFSETRLQQKLIKLMMMKKQLRCTRSFTCVALQSTCSNAFGHNCFEVRTFVTSMLGLVI